MSESTPLMIMNNRNPPACQPTSERSNPPPTPAPVFMNNNVIKINKESPVRLTSDNRQQPPAPAFMNQSVMKINNGTTEIQRPPPTLEAPPSKMLITMALGHEVGASSSTMPTSPRPETASSNIQKLMKSPRRSKPKRTGSVQERRYPLRQRRPPVRLSL